MNVRRHHPPAVRRPPARVALLASLLAGCVAYEPADVDLPGVVASAQAAAGGSFTFVGAVQTAWRDNPRLQALAAAARAAGADLAATELQVEWDGAEESLTAMIDPLALLRLGQRGAAAELTATRADAALAELAVARWQTCVAIAEAFLVLDALDTIVVPSIEIEPQPFVDAGLAAPVAAAQVTAARGAALAEQAAIAAERANTLTELRALCGRTAAVAFTTTGHGPELPPAPADRPTALLRRPDLALALQQYRVADAAFRTAVAEQYPSVMLGPEIPLRSGMIDPMAIVRIPIGADGPAAAARDQRDAARATLTGAYLTAEAEAAIAAQRLEAATAAWHARRAAAIATQAALAQATIAVQTEVDAFAPLAEAAPMAIRETMEHRETALALARARVRAAAAYGWPTEEPAR
ncbi:MAG: hypothetical protein IPK26_17030 [Planctomycetes bacterium]|nr:hypothetical protein [Planctomycetota bacterium]